MKLSKKVYRDAAKRIENKRGKFWRFACLSLTKAEHDATGTSIDVYNRRISENPHMKMFEEIMKPKRVSKQWGWYGANNIKRNQLARSLSLLFMAEALNDLKPLEEGK